MISRLTKTVLTFAVVLLAYFAYALVAAPMIEPTIEFEPPQPGEGFGKRRVAGANLDLFPPGAWERGQPKFLETAQGTLLFDDYKQLENGDLRLPHCTLISYIDSPRQEPAANASGNEAKSPPPVRRPVIMRASQGAVLSFDSPPNFMLGKFGRLVGGQLQGDVTIYSPASTLQEDDALRITTKNIQIDQKRIWAPSQVDFRFGKNQARGRDLSIYLDTPKKHGNKKSVMGKIRSLEMEHVDQVELQLKGDLFAMAAGKPIASPPAHVPAPGQMPAATPIEIKCEGPFRFDFEAMIASLEQRVDVIRHNLEGPSDQLNCELLEIHLMPKAADGTETLPADPEPEATTRPGAMQPKKIIAVGFPVMIRAPSMLAGARAERMEYDFTTRRVELSGNEKTSLYREQFYVEAPRLEYELLEGGRLGRLQAAGPGLARGQMGKDKRPFEANWAGSVSLLPQGQNKVLSLIGQTRLQLADVATLTADKLHLYLLEVPGPDGKKVEIHPDRMQASGRIELDSPQLVAFLAEAQLWFRTPDAAEISAAAAATQTARTKSGLFGQRTDKEDRKPTRLRLTADVLRGQIVMTDRPQLEALDLQNNVRVNELHPEANSTLDIAAQRVVLERGNSPTAELTLSGAPARFSAEGMTLDGTLVRVQLARNLATVEGPGSMLMLPRHVTLGEDGQSKPLNVRWKKGMHFDGQTANFDGAIETRGGHVTKDQETVQFVAQGESLRVVLNRLITFTDPATKGVDASELSFLGPAQFDSHTVDRASAVVSVDSMAVRDLVINRATGRVSGQGPGKVVHRGPNPEKKPSVQRPVAPLIFLRVDFENEMVGNLDNREIEFLNGTRTILGPITEWEQALDPQRPDLLGENSVILTSRRLAVADMRAISDNKDAIEIEATGNAQIRGSQFAAAGNRVSYIKDKDQLVLEGDGRTKSTLEFQRQAGAAWQKLSAKRILFYPQTRQFALDAFELELNDVGLSSGRPAGAGQPAVGANPAAPPRQTYRGLPNGPRN